VLPLLLLGQAVGLTVCTHQQRPAASSPPYSPSLTLSECWGC
jgi:hypothetical protein